MPPLSHHPTRTPAPVGSSRANQLLTTRTIAPLQEPYRLQLKIFLNEIRQSLQLPLIRSYLKLYSTMPIEKLAQFCEIDGEAQDAETFRIALHQYKHKTNQMAWSNGTALEGERVPTADVDFYIDSDMIHIADVKIERNFGEYFMHSIYKMCQEAQ